MAAAREIVRHEDARYEKDGWAWLTEQVMTIDEASNEVVAYPADKEYLADFWQAMDEQQKLAVPKSRRMVVTWTVAAKLTHRIRYRPHYAGFIQSEDEDKAAFVIDDRMRFIEDHLLPIWQRPYETHKTVKGRVGFLKYTGTESYVKGVAEGKDSFRAFTPSFIFMDESEFMQRGHESFVAAIPFLEKKCQIIVVSSSNGPNGILADMARLAGFTRF